MTKSPEEPAPPKPFQYSLRSLFVITTVLAVLLGLAKMFPHQVIPALVAFVIFLLYFFVARRLLLNGQRAVGIAAAITASLILLTWCKITFLVDKPVEWDVCGLMSVGVFSSPIWLFYVVFLTTRARKKRLRQVLRDRRKP